MESIKRSEKKRVFLDKFRQVVAKNKPHIAQSTVNSYASIIYRLAQECNCLEEPDYKKMSEYLINEYRQEDKQKSRYRTEVSALYAYFNRDQEKKEYLKDKMDEVINNVNASEKEFYESHEFRNSKERDSFIQWEEILEKVKVLKELVDPIMKKPRAEVTKREFEAVMSYMALRLMTSCVRRSLDYIGMVIRNPDKQEDNYLRRDGKTVEFIFNKYKTKSTYGEQKIKVEDPELSKEIDRYINLIPTTQSLLFMSKNGNSLTGNQFSALLNYPWKETNKKLSTNSLRKAYFSYVQRHVDLEKMAREAGTSVGMLISTYNKNKY